MAAPGRIELDERQARLDRLGKRRIGGSVESLLDGSNSLRGGCSRCSSLVSLLGADLAIDERRQSIDRASPAVGLAVAILEELESALCERLMMFV